MIKFPDWKNIPRLSHTKRKPHTNINVTVAA